MLVLFLSVRRNLYAIYKVSRTFTNLENRVKENMQVQDNTETLEQIIAHIVEFTKTITEYDFDEPATRQFVVLPILRALGWDDRNLKTLEVLPESRTDPENNKRIKVDYALRHEGRPLILVECKRWRENIEESEEHHEQLAKYIFQRGVDLGILTNGKTWHFYLAYKTDVLWRDRKFCSIELNKQKEAIADFQKYLFKPNVIDESARTEAEKMVQTYAERANIQMKDRAPASDEDLEPRRIPD